MSLLLLFGGTGTPPLVVAAEWVSIHPLMPDISVQISFDTDPADTPVWVNVAEDVRETHLRLYRSSELDEFQTGELTVILSNLDRELEPLYAGSSHYPQVVPRRRIRYRERYGGIEYDRFTGFITSYSLSWPGQVDAVVAVTASDYGLVLNRAQVTVNGFPEELVHERIERVLDAIGIPASDRSIATSTHTVGEEEELLFGNVNIKVEGALGHCRTAAQSDGGYLFIARDGKITFHNRTYRLDNLDTPVGTFGDGAGEIPYTESLVGSLDDSKLWNTVTVTTADGTRESVSDSDSMTAYWESRRDDFQSVLVRPGEAAALASLWVWRYKDPRLRFPRIDCVIADHPSWTGQDISVLLSADIGTRFTLKRRPPGGGVEISQDMHVEGITEDNAPMMARIGFDASPADVDESWWVIGTSALGTNTYVSP